MDISIVIPISMLLAIIFLAVGIYQKSRVFKIIAIILFCISISLFLIIWYSFSYMWKPNL